MDTWEPAEDEVATPQKKDRFLAISILVAAVLIGGAIVFSVLYHPAASPAPAVVPSAPAAQNGPTQPSAATIAAAMQLGPQDVALGNANASVTVIEYGDYQCPFCIEFFTQVEPTIVSKYVNTGEAKFVFRNFPFIDRFPGLPAGANESHDAAAAADCAKDQGQFWPFHDALYNAKVADEAKGGSENDGLFNRALFLKLAGQMSINLSTFTSCLTSGKYTAEVQNDYTAAQAAGVNSTPTTFVDGKEVVDANGQSVGASASAILAAIDTVVKGQ